jgi:hypothetical protein
MIFSLTCGYPTIILNPHNHLSSNAVVALDTVPSSRKPITAGPY